MIEVIFARDATFTERGAAMLKQERARVTRSKIVSSAAHSFHHHGFAKASLSDIIEEAGVTKGALYFHFESKEDVASAVLDAHLDRAPAVFAELQDSGLAPLAMLVQVCSLPMRPVDDALDIPVGFRLAAELANVHPALSFSFYDQWLKIITKLAHRAGAAGNFKLRIDPEKLSRFILDAITGAELLTRVLDTEQGAEHYGLTLWHVLIPQIVPEDQLASVDGILTKAFSKS